MTESAHFRDHAPVFTDDVVDYDGDLRGQGRWAVLAKGDGREAGVLWTDDRNGLGCLPVEDGDTDAAVAVRESIRAAAVMEIRATRQFDQLAAQWGADVFSGDLAEMGRVVLG